MNPTRVAKATRDELAELQAQLLEEVAACCAQIGTFGQRSGKIEIVDLWCCGPALHLAVWVDGQIVGAATLGYWDDEGCELHKLYVLPAARGGGVGSALVEAAIRFARDEGLRELRIELSQSSLPFWEQVLKSREIDLISPDHVVVLTGP